MINIAISEILEFLDSINENYQFCGNRDATIIGFSSLSNYKKGSVTWIKTKESIPKNMEMKVVELAIVQQDIDVDIINKIISSNSKRVFFCILERFFGIKREKEFIGENTYISANVKLGNNVYIGHNCTLDGNITIGDNTVIHNNVSICNNVTIGQNCEIQSCTTIGHDGFGYSIDDNGFKRMVKHYGGVEIRNDVHIGSNTAIARGTIDNTVIGNNCKIDNLCHIAHNVVLGEGVTLIAGTLLYGSSKIGENAYIASGIVRNQNSVGKNVVIGIGSVVTKNIDDDVTVIGIPAKPIK